jgi:hypothetical protein
MTNLFAYIDALNGRTFLVGFAVILGLLSLIIFERRNRR